MAIVTDEDSIGENIVRSNSLHKSLSKTRAHRLPCSLVLYFQRKMTLRYEGNFTYR